MRPSFAAAIRARIESRGRWAACATVGASSGGRLGAAEIGDKGPLGLRNLRAASPNRFASSFERQAGLGRRRPGQCSQMRPPDPGGQADARREPDVIKGSIFIGAGRDFWRLDAGQDHSNELLIARVAAVAVHLPSPPPPTSLDLDRAHKRRLDWPCRTTSASARL